MERADFPVVCLFLWSKNQNEKTPKLRFRFSNATHFQTSMISWSSNQTHEKGRELKARKWEKNHERDDKNADLTRKEKTQFVKNKFSRLFDEGNKFSRKTQKLSRKILQTKENKTSGYRGYETEMWGLYIYIYKVRIDCFLYKNPLFYLIKILSLFFFLIWEN